MESPITPEPNHVFKTTQVVTAPSGYKFEYCIDSDDDCCVSNDLEKAGENMREFFDYCDKIFR